MESKLGVLCLFMHPPLGWDNIPSNSLSGHDLKTVDWDVKLQHIQAKILLGCTFV